ncbi:transcriptional regulator, DeoR family [Tranquillimonas rosea]|uniref:Transcriptional regulator, DeoR family n=1 Tax=Tranquillimonas rosea TaxID=641238 RepID=A0A1H9WUB4_9RHOB|nr:DeoR/GlpR family DNA-binding transcription regulator [Tranquillimonas rosea]SES37379.1 transcriptional regulator, DeoR family [Tranquillimonas rosea]
MTQVKRMMHKTDRYNAIMASLRHAGSTSIAELTRKLAVSDETVRRDVKVLESRGLLERVHGAVILAEHGGEAEFQKRMAQNAAAKRAIAEATVAEVEDGDAIMIDNGTTTAYVARALLARRNLFVVTNGTEIARTLARGEGNRVHLPGGEIRPDDYSVFGEASVNFIRNFRAKMAILSIGAIHYEGGYMDFHLEEAELARTMIRQSSKVMVVADTSKFHNQAPVSVCGFEDVGTMICDRAPPGPLARRFEQHDVRVIDVSRASGAQTNADETTAG